MTVAGSLGSSAVMAPINVDGTGSGAQKRATIIFAKNLTNNELYIIPFVARLAEKLSADIIYIEDFRGPLDLYRYLENEREKILNIFFLRFRWLMSASDLQRRSSKKRVFYEQDAGQNYINTTGKSYVGAWTKYLPLLSSDLIIVNDKKTRNLLLADGIAAWWSPKAAEDDFLDSGSHRQKNFPIGYYGTRYGARAHALALMKKNRIGINEFNVPYRELSGHISSCRSILICNSLDRYYFPYLKKIQKRLPLVFIQPEPAWMVLAKNYEVCAAKSLMLADFIEEMDELGFKSGVNCLLYRDATEMIDMARWIIAHPDKVDEMAEAGFRLVSAHHTWKRRADDLADFLKTRFLMSNSMAGEPCDGRD